MILNKATHIFLVYQAVLLNTLAISCYVAGPTWNLSGTKTGLSDKKMQLVLTDPLEKMSYNRKAMHVCVCACTPMLTGSRKECVFSGQRLLGAIYFHGYSLSIIPLFIVNYLWKVLVDADSKNICFT